MNSEEWRQVDQIFSAALDREPGERTRFIKEACAGNSSLQNSIESLIASHDQAGNFLELGAANEATSLRMSIAAGTRFGPYEILAVIGAGGMGTVYKAHDARLGRDVAVKVLRRVVSDRAGWERFEREARAASALTHPNICTVHDVGEADGQPYFVMELLEGVTLSTYLSEQPLETDAALAIAMQIAEALEAAHAKGIIHRDIKPANVMISGRWRVKVLDFGLAKQTAIGEKLDVQTLDADSIVGTVMGTPPYLSPEVLHGASADARSDVWAFGVVLYQMLTGGLPFTGATVFEMGSAILKEPTPPLPASVPAAMRSIVERCLAKRPEERYQNAGEVRSALEAVHARTMPASGISRRTWLLAASAAAVSAAGGLWWLLRPEEKPPDKPRLTSTGGPASQNQAANEKFEFAMKQERELSDIPNSQKTLEEAIALDQQFAEAHRYHAFEYVLLLLNGFSNDRSILNKAEEELDQVAREVPDLITLPGAYAALYLAQGHKERVDIEKLNRVIEQRPDAPTNKNWRMILNVFAEKNDEAMQDARDLLAQNQFFAAPRLYLGDILRREGNIQDAISAQERVLAQANSNIAAIRYLTLAYLDNDEVDRARSLLEEKRSPSNSNNFLLRLAWALLYAVQGRRKEAYNAMDEETKKFASATVHVTSDVAEFYALLNQTREATDWLQKAVDNGDERSKWFLRDKRLRSIQSNDDFRRIIRNIESNKAKRKQKSILTQN